MPARGTATNRQTASNRQLAVGRLTASGRGNVDGSGGGGVVDDMTFISETIVGVGGAASVTFSAIAGSYRHLQIFLVGRSDNPADQVVGVQFNGDTAGNYRSIAFTSGGNAAATAATSIRVGVIPASGVEASSFASCVLDFPYYSTTTQFKGVTGTWTYRNSALGPSYDADGGYWANTAAVTQIVLAPAAGVFVENSRFSLYGIT